MYPWLNMIITVFWYAFPTAYFTYFLVLHHFLLAASHMHTSYNITWTKINQSKADESYDRWRKCAYWNYYNCNNTYIYFSIVYTSSLFPLFIKYILYGSSLVLSHYSYNYFIFTCCLIVILNSRLRNSLLSITYRCFPFLFWGWSCFTCRLPYTILLVNLV